MTPSRCRKNVGLEIVTDGEMRRQSFQSQMTAAVSGFGEHNLDAFLWGEWYDETGVKKTRRPRRLGAVGKLKRLRYLSADEFSYLKSKTNRIPKVTLPSPSLWANFWSPKYSRDAYPTLDAFLADIVNILREEVAELVRLGADLHSNRRATLWPPAGPEDASLLREARLESRSVAFSRHRARQRGHSRLSRCNFWIPRLTRQPRQPVAVSRRL